jgi:hypothetical protein
VFIFFESRLEIFFFVYTICYILLDLFVITYTGEWILSTSPDSTGHILHYRIQFSIFLDLSLEFFWCEKNNSIKKNTQFTTRD